MFRSRRRSQLQEAVNGIVWFHSVDLGGGVVTPGTKPNATLTRELEVIDLPALQGRDVLDIGAWDGFFSFEAERRGARRVVALDHFSWYLDHHAARRYFAECSQRGQTPQPFDRVPDIYRPDELPGRAGFELAHQTLRSRVEPVVGDFMTMDLSKLGTFDVVLFLGVLYHLRYPLEALERLVALTKEVCIIETVCAVYPGFESHAMWEFLEHDELDADPTNWWVPNRSGLTAALRGAGFSRVDVKAAPSPDAQPVADYDVHYGRAIVHAYR